LVGLHPNVNFLCRGGYCNRCDKRFGRRGNNVGVEYGVVALYLKQERSGGPVAEGEAANQSAQPVLANRDVTLLLFARFGNSNACRAEEWSKIFLLLVVFVFDLSGVPQVCAGNVHQVALLCTFECNKAIATATKLRLKAAAEARRYSVHLYLRVAVMQHSDGARCCFGVL